MNLDERVMQFQCLEMPGQPMMMHMGTSYLVNDLHAEVKRLGEQRDQLREALVASVNYVPDLGDVPGIQAALKATEDDA